MSLWYCPILQPPARSTSSQRPAEPQRPPAQLRNPHLLKSKLCDYFKAGQLCRHGGDCYYAHGEHELRSPLQPQPHASGTAAAAVGRGLTAPGAAASSSGDAARIQQAAPPTSEREARRVISRAVEESDAEAITTGLAFFAKAQVHGQSSL